MTRQVSLLRISTYCITFASTFEEPPAIFIAQSSSRPNIQVVPSDLSTLSSGQVGFIKLHRPQLQDSKLKPLLRRHVPLLWTESHSGADILVHICLLHPQLPASAGLMLSSKRREPVVGVPWLHSTYIWIVASEHGLLVAPNLESTKTRIKSLHAWFPNRANWAYFLVRYVNTWRV